MLVTQTRIQLPWNTQREKKRGGSPVGPQTSCYEGTFKETKKETLGEVGAKTEFMAFAPKSEDSRTTNHTQSAGLRGGREKVYPARWNSSRRPILQMSRPLSPGYSPIGMPLVTVPSQLLDVFL